MRRSRFGATVQQSRPLPFEAWARRDLMQRTDGMPGAMTTDALGPRQLMSGRAWRVKGADPALLLPGFKTAVQASSTTPLADAAETVAGRAVTRIGDPGQLTQGPLYVFVRGDTLWFVQTTERAVAEEAMAKLPK